MIDDRIFTMKFSCDVSKCHGACCTLKGAAGAPLLDEEVKPVSRLLGKVRKYLDEKHLQVLDREGFIEGTEGNYSLKSVDDKECVFVYYDGPIARCSLQKVHMEERNSFPKPLSCHLFPIRIKGKKRNVIRYEELYECGDAVDKGEKENITMFEFLEEPLVREYGREFYQSLKKNYMEE